jgi:hypothetical protein
MADNKPVAETEATYLQKEDDLMSLNHQQSTTDAKPTSSTHLTALMMAITSATALPIFLFRIIPGFSSRITVILLLVPSVAFMPKFQATGSFLNGRESRHFLCVYFGVLIFAALVI